jgi:hypothetical protein
MPKQRRIYLCVLLGLFSSLVCLVFRILSNDNGDFWWALHTAMAILYGIDPYVGLSETQVAYPLPIAAVGFLFLWVPNVGASVLFVGISTGLLAYGALRNGTPWELGVLLSAPYLLAVQYAQWGIIIMALSYLPILLPVLIIKPHIALPIVLTRKPSLGGLVLTGSILALSFAIMPDWPVRWLATTGKYQQIIPVTVLPLGPLLLLALYHWRDATSRMFVLFAVLPQRSLYDLLALWLCAKNWTQSLILAALSWLLYFAGSFGLPFGRVELLFIPCLILIFVNQRRAKVQPAAA